MAYGGLLSHNFAKSVIEILNEKTIKHHAYIWKLTKGKHDPQTANSYRLCITVYGMQETGRHVGEILDKAEVYLQHPRYYDTAVPYINPHYLVPPGRAQPLPTSEEQINVPIQSSLSLSADERLKGDILQVLDSSAKGPLKYSRISPSPQMRTSLKP